MCKYFNDPNVDANVFHANECTRAALMHLDMQMFVKLLAFDALSAEWLISPCRNFTGAANAEFKFSHKS